MMGRVAASLMELLLPPIPTFMVIRIPPQP
jgi:hypothetical protein